MRVVFMGTPEFAVSSLEALHDAGHEIAAVFTQPDRPAGRGHKLTPPPVKQKALELGIAVEQPAKVRAPEVVERLLEIAPRAIAVVGYGQIIPQSIIDLPPLELAELKNSLSELRADASTLPTPSEMASLLEGLRRTATAERRSLLEVSSGVGLAFLASAKTVGREHLAVPYREDWQPLRDEGFAAYATRVSRPYRSAIGGHFSPSRQTLTERAPGYGRRAIDWVRRRGRPSVTAED